MAAFGQRATLAECSEWETGKNGLIGGEVTASQQSREALQESSHRSPRRFAHAVRALHGLRTRASGGALFA